MLVVCSMSICNLEGGCLLDSHGDDHGEVLLWLGLTLRVGKMDIPLVQPVRRSCTD
jgi:hypothetical protein